MKTYNYKNLIREVILSPDFDVCLNRIAENFPNIRQDITLRNALVMQLNDKLIALNKSSIKVFTEHPITEIAHGGVLKRVQYDFSFVNQQEKEPYTIAMKYKFSGELTTSVEFMRLFRADFIDREADLYLLILTDADLEKQNLYDKSWGINTEFIELFSREKDWLKAAISAIKTSDEVTTEEPIHKIVSQPFHKDYWIFLIEKKIIEL